MKPSIAVTLCPRPGRDRPRAGAPRRCPARSRPRGTALVVPRGEVRPLHPLGPLRDPGRRVEGKGRPRDRRVDHEPREDPGPGVRGPRRAVEPREVRRRGLGAPRPGRGHEVHRHHLEAPRRLRALRLEGEPRTTRSTRRPSGATSLKELAAACAKRRHAASASTTRRRRTGTSRTGPATPGTSARTRRRTSTATCARRRSRRCASC